MKHSKWLVLLSGLGLTILALSLMAFGFNSSTASPLPIHLNAPSGQRPSPTAGVTKYTLTLGTGGPGSGSASNSPSGTVFDSGTIVTLTASAATGSTFSGWVLGGITVSTNSIFAVTMNSDKSYIAIFSGQSVQQYTLAIVKNGTGSGNVTTSPTGASFAAGTTVTLTAAENPGSSFNGWYIGGNLMSTNKVYAISMNSNTTVTATFNTLPLPQQYTLNLGFGGTGSGTVGNNPPGTTFVAGTLVTLTATANLGSTFSGWMIGGSTVSTANTFVITMDSNKTVTGVFTVFTGPTPTFTPTPTSGPTSTGTPVATITPLLQGATVTATPSTKALPSTGLPLTWLAIGIGLVIVLVAARYFRQTSE